MRTSVPNYNMLRTTTYLSTLKDNELANSEAYFELFHDQQSKWLGTTGIRFEDRFRLNPLFFTEVLICMNRSNL